MTRVEGQQSSSLQEPQNAVPVGNTQPVVNPERWVQDYGDALFGFAVMRVRDRAIAEDLVQETFLAAIKASQAFSGRSTERAWLFGILRNKLVDHYRLQSRVMPLADLETFLPEESGAFAQTGVSKDGWAPGVGPEAWETPEAVLVNKEFRQTLNSCLAGLPHKAAQVFVLREIDGVSSDEICKDLGVSPNNLWVMLHRARMGLRRCLEIHWFARTKNEK